jgi:hypothetical protein
MPTHREHGTVALLHRADGADSRLQLILRMRGLLLARE